MTWVKGQPSPNPGGRSKTSKEVARLIAAETRNGAELVEFLLGTVRGSSPPAGCKPYPTDDRSRIDAVKILFDRFLGKAPMLLEVAPEEAATLPDMREKTLEELLALATGGDGEPPANVH